MTKTSDKCSNKEKDHLQRLGEELFRIGSLPIQKEKSELWRKLNDREAVRPLVLVNPIPLKEVMCAELEGICTDPFLQEVERYLLNTLFKWKHYAVDQIYLPIIPLKKVWHSTDIGISQQGRKIQHTAGVTAQSFTPQICDMKDIEKIQVPEVTLDTEETERRYEILTDIFADICPVKLSGINHIWFTPWDYLIRLVGLEDIMMDMIMRPDFVEAMVTRYVDVKMQELDQIEELGLLSTGNINCRVGSGGYGNTHDLPVDGKPTGCKEMWGCGNAQIFSEISPEMHWDFSLKQEQRWLDRWGLTYYGCCEPLHNKIDILKNIKNLRKISVSAWFDIPQGRANGADDYIFSIKPNPAILAEETFDENQARHELRTVLDQSKGCNVEIVMKDMSTLRGDVTRIWRWAEIAMQEVQR